MSWAYLLLPLAVAALVLARVIRARQLAEQWAQRNGFTIVKREQTWFRPNPFPLAQFTKASVHYLVVRDAFGETRKCWLAIGDKFIGHLDNRIEVVWD